MHRTPWGCAPPPEPEDVATGRTTVVFRAGALMFHQVVTTERQVLLAAIAASAAGEDLEAWAAERLAAGVAALDGITAPPPGGAR